MVDRIERLTNLLALLLETAEPLSLVQIAAALDGQYPDSDKARRAAFERDKAALRDLGAPIETEIVGGGPYAGQTRYRIDRRAYELADLDLAPDEMRALQVAVAAVRTDSGRDALWKLGGTLGDERPAVSVVIPERPELPAIRSAVAARAPIEFGYRGEQRVLEPWGLLLRGGFWYVTGHDHARGERRTFRVDRFDRLADGDTGVRLGAPGSFERPASFDPRTAFPADPKQIGDGADESIDAIVLIDALRAGAVERELGPERVVGREPDGSIRVSVPAGNRAAFRSWVLGLLEHAVVESPPDLRQHIIDWLGAVAGGSDRTNSGPVIR
ncbi:MAG TPA: WYL domain-containing protein [Ilumatobacteraceae bacterium]|nr:WYL domain-containing protein [Ilumatobacteraceae bacterium]